MRNTQLFYIVFQVLMVLLKNFVRYSHHIFLFLLAFTSAGITFLKFLELLSTISGKKYFRHKFSFFDLFAQTAPHPLNDQNLVSVTKFFCCCYNNMSQSALSFDSRTCFDQKTKLLFLFFFLTNVLLKEKKELDQIKSNQLYYKGQTVLSLTSIL